mmetsp:Transcript_21419/g.57110  ORF Transcript_21419/g.57110 Transcript_21419/m.57110 type:complete len:221 (+) Transcript_21419:586-1248(+)
MTALSNPRIHCSIVIHVEATWRKGFFPEGIEGLLFEHLHRQPQRIALIPNVLRRRQEIWINQRRCPRISGSKSDTAATRGAQRTAVRLETMERQDVQLPNHKAGDEVQLDVRMLESRCRTQEGAHFEMVRCSDTCAREEPRSSRSDGVPRPSVQVFVDGPKASKGRRVGIQGGVPGLVLDVMLQVVLKVLPNLGEMMAHLNAQFTELCAIPNATQHQQLW